VTAEPSARTRASASGVEAFFLEVEFALDDVAGVVPDLPVVAQPDELVALCRDDGVQDPLVVVGAGLGVFRVVESVPGPLREPADAELVEAARPFEGVRAGPVLAAEPLQLVEGGPGGGLAVLRGPRRRRR
jgi:hypothetical protein